MTDSNESTRALMATIDSLTVQRDAAEAMARSNSDPAHARALADATADRLFVEGERDAARNDLAIARDHLEAANNAHTEAEADLATMTADRDAAQQMVAELKALIVDMKHKAEEGWRQTDCACIECVADAPPQLNGWKCTRHRVDIVLEKVAPITGRWCLASERDEAVARLVQGCSGCGTDPVCRQCSDASTAEHLRSLVAAAERRESELGVQVEAQKARLRLADRIAKALRDHGEGRNEGEAQDALDAWDAVPGDVSVDMVPRCRSTRCVGATLEEVERCAGAAGHRSVCFGGVPPPPTGES
jgi:hypothetical protein